MGISYRQIDYWERSGIMTSTIPPVGSGSRARLDADCVKGVGVLAVLLPHTISMPGSYPQTPCTPPWEQILEAVHVGGRWELDPSTGRFSITPILDAEVIITVNVTRIAERVGALLAELPPVGAAGSRG